MGTLWRVDVAGVSHRFVEAESKGEALDLVRADLAQAIDLRAEKPDPQVTSAYNELTPGRRRKLIAALDGLASPAAVRRAASARRRLAREVRFALEERRWRESARSGFSRLVSPDAVSVLLRHGEQERVALIRGRLTEAQRRMSADRVGADPLGEPW